MLKYILTATLIAVCLAGCGRPVSPARAHDADTARRHEYGGIFDDGAGSYNVWVTRHIGGQFNEFEGRGVARILGEGDFDVHVEGYVFQGALVLHLYPYPREGDDERDTIDISGYLSEGTGTWYHRATGASGRCTLIQVENSTAEEAPFLGRLLDGQKYSAPKPEKFHVECAEVGGSRGWTFDIELSSYSNERRAFVGPFTSSAPIGAYKQYQESTGQVDAIRATFPPDKASLVFTVRPGQSYSNSGGMLLFDVPKDSKGETSPLDPDSHIYLGAESVRVSGTVTVVATGLE